MNCVSERKWAFIKEHETYFIVIKAVADDKGIGNGEAAIPRLKATTSTGALFQQRRHAEASGFGILLQVEHQLTHGQSGINQVFDYK